LVRVILLSGLTARAPRLPLQVANGLAGIRNFTPETSSLWPIRCETWGPLVFLHMGDNADLPSVAEVMGAGGELLAAEGVKDDDWQFYKRVEYPCVWPPALRACIIW
jgi:hypothetical protein